LWKDDTLMGSDYTTELNMWQNLGFMCGEGFVHCVSNVIFLLMLILCLYQISSHIYPT
jgi:hypothetical protein